MVVDAIRLRIRGRLLAKPFSDLLAKPFSDLLAKPSSPITCGHEGRATGGDTSGGGVTAMRKPCRRGGGVGGEGGGGWGWGGGGGGGVGVGGGGGGRVGDRCRADCPSYVGGRRPSDRRPVVASLWFTRRRASQLSITLARGGQVV